MREVTHFTNTNKSSYFINKVRVHVFIKIMISITILAIIFFGGLFLDNGRLSTNLEMKNVPPSFVHPFGTDWLGRDMFMRTLTGLTVSFAVGFIAASISAFIAIALSILCFFGDKWDRLVSWFIDLFLSVPHLITLILISFTLGGGLKGVVIGIGLTHWTSLARVLQAEILKLKSAEYIAVSKQLGKTKGWIARHHLFPHLVPQLIVGFILMFAHAVLHEAAITFLGFGLSPQLPAVGNILSESMSYLSTGMWWLAFFPGISLLVMVRSFDTIAWSLRKIISPPRSFSK
jgi:peptide/nickel transport system permease protein